MGKQSTGNRCSGVEVIDGAADVLQGLRGTNFEVVSMGEQSRVIETFLRRQADSFLNARVQLADDTDQGGYPSGERSESLS